MLLFVVCSIYGCPCTLTTPTGAPSISPVSEYRARMTYAIHLIVKLRLRVFPLLSVLSIS